MSDTLPPIAARAVFLSYASQDADAARRIRDALRAAGLLVWFDQSELRGGDEWDRKIRRQIKDCVLFLPIISANTQARREGYFRLEWKLADDRTQLMARGTPFLVPVCIDDTKDWDALVPESFMTVQWTRLPVGETPQDFCERVKELFLGQTGAESAPHSTAAAPFISAGPARSRSWLVPAIMGAALLVTIAYFTLRSQRSPAGSAPPLPSAPAAAAKSTLAPAPVSELRQLVAKARALYEPWDFATADDLKLAEQLLKRAVELDPTDGEAWAAQSVLSAGLLVFSFDASSERREAVRLQAERAFRLAPDLDLVRFARAFSLRFQRSTQEEALRLMREEAGRQPTNRFVLRMLGSSLRVLGYYEEALAVLDRVAAFPGGDAIAHYNRSLALGALQRQAEAETAIDQALALAPGYGVALITKISDLMSRHSDLVQARALTEQMPLSFLTDDRGIAVASRVWLNSQEWDRAIAALGPARDYIQNSFFVGPKALLSGIAHYAAGRPEAARTDWHTALRVVEQRLVTQPNATYELGLKARLLALLGEKAEAQRVLQVYEQLKRGDPGKPDVDTWATYIALGRHEDVIVWLAAGIGSGNQALGKVLPEDLRYDPELNPLRGDPRFQELLARWEARASSPRRPRRRSPVRRRCRTNSSPSPRSRT